jgi:hypothetical protein
MPKTSKYPRLRTKVYRGAAGQVYAYYVYDMRPEGKPDIRLGTDHAEAIQKWDELHNQRPRTVGRLQEAFERWRRHPPLLRPEPDPHRTGVRRDGLGRNHPADLA